MIMWCGILLAFISNYVYSFNVPIDFASHINTSCSKEVNEYNTNKEIVDNIREECFIFSKTMESFEYSNGAKVVDIFKQAMMSLVSNDIGRDLINVIFTKLRRKRNTWSFIIENTKIHKRDLLQAVNRYKEEHNQTELQNLKNKLNISCDFIRCVLSPENPDNIMDSSFFMQSNNNIDFHNFYSFSNLETVTVNIYKHVRSLYTTNEMSNLYGERLESMLSAIPYNINSQYYNLFHNSVNFNKKIKIIFEMLDTFIDISYKVKEWDSTIEIMDFYKCCFSPSAKERSKICLNFEDYEPSTLESKGEYSVIKDLPGPAWIFENEDIRLDRIKKRLFDAIFHEFTHFLHFIEGKRLTGNINLEILFGMKKIDGTVLSPSDQNNRKEMIRKWTKDEELTTILGIKFENGKMIFDKLSNAGLMYNSLSLIRIWHVAMSNPSFVSTEEEKLMAIIFDIIKSAF